MSGNTCYIGAGCPSVKFYNSKVKKKLAGKIPLEGTAGDVRPDRVF
jgi:hypothetical protein